MVAAFTTAPAITCPHPIFPRDKLCSRGTGCVFRTPCKQRHVVPILPSPSRAPTIMCDAPSSLKFQRRDIERKTGHGRVARFELQTTQRELDLDNGAAVDVKLVAQPVRAHFRVRGAVSSSITLTCDRCLASYPYPARGTFEVWLSSSGSNYVQGLSDQETQALEAIEDFCGPNAAVDFAPHIRDAILLATPTKALCKPDCAGIPIRDTALGSVKYAGASMAEKDRESDDNLS